MLYPEQYMQALDEVARMHAALVREDE